MHILCITGIRKRTFEVCSFAYKSVQNRYRHIWGKIYSRVLYVQEVLYNFIKYLAIYKMDKTSWKHSIARIFFNWISCLVVSIGLGFPFTHPRGKHVFFLILHEPYHGKYLYHMVANSAMRTCGVKLNIRPGRGIQLLSAQV